MWLYELFADVEMMGLIGSENNPMVSDKKRSAIREFSRGASFLLK